MNDELVADETEAATDESPPRANLEKLPWWIQAPWIILAFFGFVANLFGSPGASFPWHPVWSPTALAWFGAVIVGAIINSLDKFGMPGGPQLSFRERTRRAIQKQQFSVEAMSSVVAEYSDLLQNWANTVNLLGEQLERYAKTDQDIANIVTRFCLGRMEEAKDFVVPEGDVVRFSFWWFDAEAEGLRLLISDDIRDEATLNFVFKPGAGLCGQCYVEDRYFNLADAPSSIYYEKIPGVTPQYRGLLLVPVKPRTDERAIGVLSIDRVKAEEFDDNARNVGSALADLIAFAMSWGEDYIEEISAGNTSGEDAEAT